MTSKSLINPSRRSNKSYQSSAPQKKNNAMLYIKFLALTVRGITQVKLADVLSIEKRNTSET